MAWHGLGSMAGLVVVVGDRMVADVTGENSTMAG